MTFMALSIDSAAVIHVRSVQLTVQHENDPKLLRKDLGSRA